MGKYDVLNSTRKGGEKYGLDSTRKGGEKYDVHDSTRKGGEKYDVLDSTREGGEKYDVLNSTRKGGEKYDVLDSTRKGDVPFSESQDLVSGKLIGVVPMVLTTGGIAALLAIGWMFRLVVSLRPAQSEEPLAEGAEMATNEDLTDVYV